MTTHTFYGRKNELCEIREALDPSRHGRKSLMLYGIGGVGKTQLALQHIQQDGHRYSAILWVNASTTDHARMSFGEAATTILSSWPRELPVAFAGPDNVLKVVARLRSTRYTNWLIVIDSIDDPNGQLSRYVPSGEYGSVLVTSTRQLACNGFIPDKPLLVEGLDPQSSRALIIATAERIDTGEDRK
jgi:hypothetical protein